MTAPTYRSKSYPSGMSSPIVSPDGTGVTHAAEPAGAAQDDILIWDLLLYQLRNVLTPPSGWSLAYNIAGGSELRAIRYWIRRGASAPALTIGFDGYFYCESVITCWQGAKTSGSPFGAVSHPANVGTGTQLDSAAITTTASDSTIITHGMHWLGAPSGGWTAPSGYTGRELGSTGQGIAIASKALTGESGTSQDPGSLGTTSSGEYWAGTTELLSADSGGGTTTRNFTMMGLGS